MKMVDTQEYVNFVEEVKRRFQSSQIKASIQVNSTLLEFYWYLGGEIVEKQKEFKWGSDFLTQLSKDLSKTFSNIKGFSKSNLQYIRRWHLFYSEEKVEQVVPQLVQIPWGHNLVIISKCKTIEEALFYVQKTVENGYSRAVLVHQIEGGLFQRNGKAITNFEAKLPPMQSDLARESLKDPYCFDFLTLSERYNEKELEDALIENVTSLLLEMGSGFAFVGRQYKVDVDNEEYFIDLLFYHLKLYCYVVVELKVVDFKPEFIGKLNFYTSVIDDRLKGEKDNPTIGLLICKSKKRTVVEYALRGIEKPLGVSEYRLTNMLPEHFKSSLPPIEEIENELNKLSGEESVS